MNCILMWQGAYDRWSFPHKVDHSSLAPSKYGLLFLFVEHQGTLNIKIDLGWTCQIPIPSKTRLHVDSSYSIYIESDDHIIILKFMCQIRNELCNKNISWLVNARYYIHWVLFYFDLFLTSFILFFCFH